MKSKVPPFLLEKSSPAMFRDNRSARGSSFMDKGLSYIAGVIRTGYDQWEQASQKGFLQKIDPRAKLFFLFLFILLVSLKQTMIAEASIAVFIGVLVVISSIKMTDFYKRIFLIAFVFGFLVALPASLNIITGGEVLVRLFEFPVACSFMGHHIPQQVGLTRQGLAGVAMLTVRVANSAALSLLVISTTPFHEIIKALKILRVPDVLIMIFTLTYKYIFIFAKTVESLYLARKSRVASLSGGAEGRTWVAGRMAFIFRKTRLRCEEVFKAMLARGYTDEVRFYGTWAFLLRDISFSVFAGVAGLFIGFM